MIRKSIRYELKRAFESIWFWISLLIGTLVVLLDLWTFYGNYGKESDAILLQAWIGTDYLYAWNTLYYVLLPILACLPHGGSYFQDRKSGYDKNLCVRISRKAVVLSKMVAVYVSAFCAVTIPLILNLFLAAGLYPNQKPERLTFCVPGIIDSNLFPVLFQNKPVMYCLVFILIAGMFGGLAGLMSVAAGVWCRSRFAAVLLPFVIYILTGVGLSTESSYNHFAVIDMINPIQPYITGLKDMIMLYVGILAVESVIISVHAGRRDIL